QRVRRSARVHAHRTALEYPLGFQALDVRRVDLVEQAVALTVVAAVVGDPVMRLRLAGLEDPLIVDALRYGRGTADVAGAQIAKVDRLAGVDVLSLGCHQLLLSLRPWLGWTVELGLVYDLASDDDRAGKAATLVVSSPGAVPVVARTVELEGRPALREVHQPDELGVAVARQNRAVRVVVVVDQLELEGASVREHEHAGVEDQLVERDPHSRVHLAVGSLVGYTDVAPAQHPSERHPVLFRQAFDNTLIDSGSHSESLLPSENGRNEPNSATTATQADRQP